ncbi:MAG: phosphatase PAP2 family protein [Hyphomicrobiales bacterium]|nr:phosphatase PAP2 family protein [Hyphomicrobiales bacterium]
MAGSFDLLVVAAAVVLSLCIFGTMFSYLATSPGLPLLDSRLAAMDRSLGIDWLRLVAMANSNRTVSAALVLAYRSTLPLVLATGVILALFNDRIRLAEFLAILALSSLLGEILMAFIPAAGAYAYYAPAREIFSNFTGAGGLAHLQTFSSLRHDAAPVLDFTKLVGLVSFPSFHTVWAIVTAYAFRKLRLLFWPVAVLNALVIVSTLPEGGHHFADVIAGFVLAALSIAVVRAVSESPRPRQALDWPPRSAVEASEG